MWPFFDTAKRILLFNYMIIIMLIFVVYRKVGVKLLFQEVNKA